MTDSPPPDNPPLPATVLVPVKPRHDGWTPERQVGFIEKLADTGCVKEAALSVEMTEGSAYRLRRRTDAAAFDAAWSAALEKGIEQLASTAIARAIQGRVKRTFYRGELINEEVVHSERLLIYLLDKGRAALGRAAERQQVAQDWDGAMAALEHPRVPGEPKDGYRVWRDPWGTRCTNYPPPPRFNGFEEGSPGVPGYNRSLTKAEHKAEDAREAAMLQGAQTARARRFGAKA